jgi:hypothetical protein
MNNPNQAPQPSDDLAEGFELDLESDAPLAPACPLNPGEGECEACQ